MLEDNNIRGYHIYLLLITVTLIHEIGGHVLVSNTVLEDLHTPRDMEGDFQKTALVRP